MRETKNEPNLGFEPKFGFEGDPYSIERERMRESCAKDVSRRPKLTSSASGHCGTHFSSVELYCSGSRDTTAPITNHQERVTKKA